MKKYIAIALITLSFSCIAEEELPECKNASSTIEINECGEAKLEYEKAVLDKILLEAYEMHKDDPKLVESIELAQKNWESYSSTHCDSVFMKWRMGSIATIKYISCEIELTKQRTHKIRKEFLMD